jgi:hypothetical protein
MGHHVLINYCAHDYLHIFSSTLAEVHKAVLEVVTSRSVARISTRGGNNDLEVGK